MHLSYAHGVAATPLLGQTIGANLDQVAAQYPDNDALVSLFENRRFTYHQFNQDVSRCASALTAIGVRTGDRVGIWATNCVAWVQVQFATARIGAILVTINPAYRLHELEYALQQSECNYLITGRRFKDSDYTAMLHELVPELPAADAQQTLRCSRFPALRRVVLLDETDHANSRVAGMLPWDEMIAGGGAGGSDALARQQANLDFDDVVNIQYTSGTTGFPKAAMLTHLGLLNNGYWVAEHMRLTSADRLCIPVPFYHCFGMVLGNLACVTHGATMVLPAPHFSPLHTLQAIVAERCTAVHGVPTMFIAQLDHPQFGEFDLSTLRTGIMAGAPCPAPVMERVMSQMHCNQITIACGMTETSPVCNMTQTDDPLDVRVNTVGKVMPHQEQKIIDPDTGHIVPRGQPGELCYRGYNVMRGYYNNPDATRQTIDPAGWLHGGDLAVMDEQGYVRITGRLKDMIARGGEKIFPREVEEYLFTHPDIAEAYVIGVPDAYYGEEVVAWVKVRDGASLTEEQVREYCRGKIMDYKIPKRVKLVSEFPTTVTGKIQKYKMRQVSAAELAGPPARS
jgi:fatty-acyl-CoA synthase